MNTAEHEDARQTALINEWLQAPCTCQQCRDVLAAFTPAEWLAAEDQQHTPIPGMPKRCGSDGEHWPCLWEQRRIHLAAALKVVEAARVWAAGAPDAYWRPDNDLVAAVEGFDAWEREHTPKTPNSAGASNDAPGARRG